MKIKNPILTVFLTIFLDLLGVGIAIPVLAFVILEPTSGILNLAASTEFRNIILGLLIAAYPLAQFFGAPILGALSDRNGRKKLLTLSIAGSFIGYLLFAVGIITANLPLLFISRLIAGFTGGNISIAQSIIADVTKPEDKSKNFGLIGMAVGFGFIIGPFVGGVTSDPSVVSWFNYATPFWLASMLTLLNLFLVIFYLPETIKVKNHNEISILTGLKNILKAFKLPNLRVLFLVFFLLVFGFNFFTSFLQVYLYEVFNLSQSEVGNFFAFMGLCIALSQGLISRPLASRFKPATLFQFSLIGLSVALLLILIPTKSYQLYFVFPLISIFQGINMPNSTALVSNAATADSQGEVLGINSSIQAFAMAIPPIIAGVISSISPSLPILVGSGFIFLAWVVFIFIYKPNNRAKFQAE